MGGADLSLPWDGSEFELLSSFRFMKHEEHLSIYVSILLLFFTDMGAHNCVCSQTWTQSPEISAGHLPQSLSILFFETNSLNLWLAYSARLASQPAPGILSSLPLHCWDYSCISSHLVFLVVFCWFVHLGRWVNGWVLGGSSSKHIRNWAPPQPYSMVFYELFILLEEYSLTAQLEAKRSWQNS